MTFVRPDEQARLLLRHDQERPVREGHPAGHGRAAAAARRRAEIPKLINPDKLPDFSVFAKYLTLGGSYSVTDEDGLVATGFTLRKN